MLESLNSCISIDGTIYEPKGFEWHAKGSDVEVGEKIGVLV